MKSEVLILVSASAAVVLLGACIGVVIFFRAREKRIIRRIQQMLDDAIDGRFQDEHLDETGVSAIENTMWRYLCDNEMAYQKLSREKEQIQLQISDISHQSVTPISNIVLYSQLLEEWLVLQESDGSPEAAGWTAAIREQAKTLEFLVGSLVKLSRLETGIIKVNMEKQKLQPVLRALQQQFMPKAEQKGVRLTVEPTEETAVFDLKWTIEAAANVVDNAIKYTPCGGEIVVSAEAYSFFVCIRVADQGIGIPEEEQASVFSRFYRSPGVSGEPGLGIGLYLAREVMKAQNGYIKLASREGRGSVFSLFLLTEEISQK